MASQQHKIMRQVLEVSGCAPAHAPRVQSELRRAYYGRLLPAIEKTCSLLSAPGRLHRIDTLEIDLGEVPLDQLEAALAEKFDAAFGRALAAAMSDAGSADADSDLELFSYFIRTGTVPWWADRSDPRLLEASLEALLSRAPRALGHAIESAPAKEMVWRRLALAYPDRLLDQLVGLLNSRLGAGYPRLGTQWLAMLDVVAGTQSYPKSVARTFWWEELLRASSAKAAPVADVPRFLEAILFRLARRLGIQYRSLVADLHRALDHAHLPLQPWVRDMVGMLHQDAVRSAATTHDPIRAAREELARLLARSESRGALDDHTWPRLRALIARLPSNERADTLAQLPPAVAAQLRQSGVFAQGRPTTELARPEQSGESRPRTPVDLRFSDADELYVENAGLVILWPFLESFFAQLGLLDAKQFKDPAALQRAIGLLQYIAAEEATALEYLVPLNKVLCGLPLDDVFDFGPPITPAEIEACTDVLSAAIQHAPILHDMSIRGFRGSFLLRQGQLSVRDGNWLLRVERETHDIVLDRFPWSVRIVKLPWMSAIMQVEW